MLKMLLLYSVLIEPVELFHPCRAATLILRKNSGRLGETSRFIRWGVGVRVVHDALRRFIHRGPHDLPLLECGRCSR